ncbi:hypothetical protein NL676_018314 [Syzygium grande]|nr:hypothetical protein NL676_018314 [Syzygium grande]
MGEGFDLNYASFRLALIFALRLPLVRWFASYPNPPVAILFNFFLGWSLDLANKLGVHPVLGSALVQLELDSIAAELIHRLIAFSKDMLNYAILLSVYHGPVSARVNSNGVYGD